MKKIVTIIGARPQIIKAAAISRALSKDFKGKIQEIIVHTGQHYDSNMSEVFFEELGIPKPDYNLDIGSGQHGDQTARMIQGIENILLEEKPDLLLIYGDTNSTVAGSLAASKLHIDVAHIEAGLRSFNKGMPEEVNRVLSDHVSSLMFCPTDSALNNLKNEGFSLNRPVSSASIDQPGIYKSGDVMLDNTLYFSKVAETKKSFLKENGLEANNFILSTCHRPSNTDHAGNINSIFTALLEIGRISDQTVVLPIHPRTQKCFDQHIEPELKQAIQESERFLIIPPVSFLEMILLENNSSLIVTDSGGVQKEAFFLKKPCIVLREETEWVELVENGNAVLTGPDQTKIINAHSQLTNRSFSFPDFYGDGFASEKICATLEEFMNQ